MIFKSSLAIIFLIVIISFFAINANAKIVEKIIVIVNDEVITLTEFEDRLNETRNMFKQVYKYNDAKLAQEMEKAKAQILDTMINEILFIQDAVKRKIQITDVEVLKEINNLKKQFSSDKEFEQALEAEGYTLDALKREKKRELLLRELISQQFASDLAVTDDEVRRFYQENRDQFPGQNDIVKLKQILIKFKFTQTDKDKAKQRADMILEQIRSGADFAEMAEKFSDDPGTKANKGDMGYFMPGKGQFPEIESVASKLDIGQVSELIETPNGYNIIRITDKKIDGSIRAQIIHIAVWPDASEEERAEKEAESILQKIKNGANFVDMVKLYSNDEQSKAKEGDWVEVPVDNMGPELSGAFSSFDTGSISKVIKTPQGFHIFKISERKDLSNEEIEQLRMFLSEKKLQERLDKYSNKLRETSYIQIFDLNSKS